MVTGWWQSEEVSIIGFLNFRVTGEVFFCIAPKGEILWGGVAGEVKTQATFIFGIS